MSHYTVQPGDCLSSIAHQTGFTVAAIWDHPENASIKRQRTTPNILRPGDVVFIPEKKVRHEERASDARHRFTLKHGVTMLKLRLTRNGLPRSSEKYAITVSGATTSGTTDEDGRIEMPIPADAIEGTLTLASSGESVRLLLGHLDPLETAKGVQGRLRNLGLFNGPVSGQFDDTTGRALRAFQKKRGLVQNGSADDATRHALREEHGS